METVNGIDMFSPGNGTTYGMVRKDMGDRVLLCCIHRGMSGGSCMIIMRDSTVHWSYMAEKIGVSNKADLAGMLAYVSKYITSVIMPPGYGDDGLYSPEKEAEQWQQLSL